MTGDGGNGTKKTECGGLGALEDKELYEYLAGQPEKGIRRTFGGHLRTNEDFARELDEIDATFRKQHKRNKFISLVCDILIVVLLVSIMASAVGGAVAVWRLVLR